MRQDLAHHGVRQVFLFSIHLNSVFRNNKNYKHNLTLSTLRRGALNITLLLSIIIIYRDLWAVLIINKHLKKRLNINKLNGSNKFFVRHNHNYVSRILHTKLLSVI